MLRQPGDALHRLSQGHANVDGNGELTQGFSAEEIMTPQVLAPAGYTSAVFGKWGFGATRRHVEPASSIVPDSLPTNHGFDEFYGYLNHGAAHDYFYRSCGSRFPIPNRVCRRASAGRRTPQYTHDLFAAKSEQFVAAHAGRRRSVLHAGRLHDSALRHRRDRQAPGGYGQYAAHAVDEPTKSLRRDDHAHGRQHRLAH